METRPITGKIIQFTINTNHILALDDEGRMWCRDVPAYDYNKTPYTTSTTNPGKEKEKQEEKYIWRLIPMVTFVDRDPIPAPKEIPADENVVPLDVVKTEVKTIPEIADPEEDEYLAHHFGM